MESVFQDLRFALRTLAKSRLFSAAAILTLALGIGGNFAIFSVVHAVFFRPLPFPEEHRLVRLHDTTLAPGGQVYRGNLLTPRWDAISRGSRAFDRFTAQRPETLTWNDGNAPSALDAASVSPGTMELFGISPVLGRAFTAEEERLGAGSHAALISSTLWKLRFGSDPAVIGRPIRLPDRTLTVVGVLPEGFRFPYHANLWMPLSIDAADRHDVLTIARLAPGVDIARAKREMASLAKRLEADDPALSRGRGIEVTLLRQDLVRGEQRVPLALMAAVGFLLLLGCANLANLLLARSVGRQKEMAIRAALGATRWRQVRQLLAESLTLSAVGGALGVLGAHSLASPLSALVPRVLDEELSFGRPTWEPGLLAFALVVSTATGLLFGLAPAWSAVRRDVASTLKWGGRSLSGGGPRRILSALAIGEIALATVLLAAAAWMLSDLQRLQDADVGLRAEGLLAMQVSLPEGRYAESGVRAATVDAILREARAVPGVQAAGVTTINPFWGGTWGIGIAPEGADPSRPFPSVNFRLASPGLFQTLGTSVVAGRDVSAVDRAGAPDVAIVSQRLARRFWGSSGAVGRAILRRTSDGRLVRMEVVGVVGDVLDAGELADAVYMPYAQLAGHAAGESFWLMARARGPNATLRARGEGFVSDLRRALARVDPALAPSEVAPEDALYARSLAQNRLGASVLSLFAAFGLLLATVGIFGVVSFTARQRRPEIAIRIALGAAPSDISSLVLRQGLSLAAMGVAIGLVADLGAHRLLSRALPDLSSSPWAALAIAGALFVVAGAASYLPARRASRVDALAGIRES
ncbi:MAG: ABC transporter permease [Acidobacteriota bacterium]